MKRRIYTRINARMFLFILPTTIVIYLTALGFISWSFRDMTYREACKLTDSHARETATIVKNKLDSYMDASRVIAQIFEGYQNFPENERREIFMNILEKTLKDNKDFLAVWSIWEANSIDKFDKKFINKRGCTRIGNFSPTFYRLKDRVKMQPTDGGGELFAGDYYTIPKKTKEEIILNPYNYSYTDNQEDAIMQTNMIVPIINAGRFLGVIGIDAKLSTFQEVTDKIRPFDEGYCFLLANDGCIITHPNRNFIGKKISEVKPDMVEKNDFENKVKKGISFSFLKENEKNDETEYISIMPLKVGKTSTPWAVAVVVPEKAIMQEANNNLVFALIAAFIGLIIMGIVVWIISHNITRPLVQIAKLLKKLNRSNINELRKISRKFNDEIGDIADSARTLIHWLNATGEFARQIGEGNLDAKYKLLSNDDILGNSLLEMRDHLKENKEAEGKRKEEIQQRNWITEGIAKFGEILRRNNMNLNDFSYNLISNLVNYLDANQGGFFILNDEKSYDKFFELTSAIAYDRRKYDTKRIEWNEGLIGACAMEKEPIFMTEIPQEYIEIESGLGEANPNCILIVPLIANEEVHGIIEIAGFNEFKPHQIEFVKRVSANMAITISNMKINIQTQKLLTESKEQSDLLKNQDDELRQNLRELRKTQQEAAEREKNLKKNLEELQRTNYELEQKYYALASKSKRPNNEDVRMTA